MTEEKNDDLNEQQSFVSGHEELLKSSNEKKDVPEEQPEQAEPTEAAPEVETAEAAPEAMEEPEQIAQVAAPSPTQKVGPKTLGGKKKKKAPQHTDRDNAEEQRHQEVLKQQEFEQQEVTEVLAFLKKYIKPAVIAIVGICALVLANGFFKNQRLNKEALADSALMYAQSAEDLQAIVDDYASTPAEPFALMGLAREKFNEGKIDEAEALYTSFTKKHGSHELAAQAKLNLISCKEAKGQQDEASRLYGEFAKGNEGSYLVPSAMMSQARCLEALGRFDEAQIVYEDIIADFPESSWTQLADGSLKTVLGKK